MKKFLLSLSLVFLAFMTLTAQDGKSNKYEVGLGWGLYLNLTDDDVQVTYHQGLNAFFEWRHAAGKHFDYGARVDTKFGLASMDHYKGTILYGGLLGVADFNFLPGKTVNPYIGIGFGPAVGLINVGYSHAHFVLTSTPRIGVELNDRIRISIEADLSIMDYGGRAMVFEDLFSPWCLNVSWVF